jgi:hypothetical protein
MMQNVPKQLLILLLILCASPPAVSAFSASPPPTFLGGLSSFFNNQGNSGISSKELQGKRQTLKNGLLELCKDEKKVSRANVESLIGELREVQPFKDTATSDLLQKEWLL